MYSDTEDYWAVLDVALETDKIRVIQGSDYTLAEVLPDVWEVVATTESQFGDLKELTNHFWGPEAHKAGGYLISSWITLEDGRRSCMLLLK